MKTLLYSLIIFSLLFNITITSAQGREKAYTDSMELTRGIDVKQTTDRGYILADAIQL